MMGNERGHDLLVHVEGDLVQLPRRPRPPPGAVFRVSCFMFFLSSLMIMVSCFLAAASALRPTWCSLSCFGVSCFLFLCRVSCFCFLFHVAVSCFMLQCLVFLFVSCFMLQCFLFLVSCFSFSGLMIIVSCFLCPIWALRARVSILDCRFEGWGVPTPARGTRRLCQTPPPRLTPAPPPSFVRRSLKACKLFRWSEGEARLGYIYIYIYIHTYICRRRDRRALHHLQALVSHFRFDIGKDNSGGAHNENASVELEPLLSTFAGPETSNCPPKNAGWQPAGFARRRRRNRRPLHHLSGKPLV